MWDPTRRGLGGLEPPYRPQDEGAPLIPQSFLEAWMRENGPLDTIYRLKKKFVVKCYLYI
jgi:hypothetical protein